MHDTVGHWVKVKNIICVRLVHYLFLVDRFFFSINYMTDTIIPVARS